MVSEARKIKQSVLVLLNHKQKPERTQGCSSECNMKFSVTTADVVLLNGVL